MIVKRHFEPLLAQASYLIGCGACGQAIVIDPNRDADLYIAAAAAHNLKITHVTETHIHADFVSGSRELASKTGAKLLLSGEGGPDWSYRFEATPIRNGDRIQVGNVVLEAGHTPGHTPEHLVFLITDGAVADLPIAAVTGDFIFVGDVGRPDLLERAVQVKGSMEAAAKTLFRSLEAFDVHEDWLQIWPGHGAGSPCGKGISAVPHSTLGYERRFNWAFKVKSEAEFVASALAGQPDPPKYFATMKRMNRDGPPLIGGFHTPNRLDHDDLARVIARGGLIIDTRPAAEYAGGFLDGTINLPLNTSFVTWAGWLVPYDQDIHLLMAKGSEARLPEVVRALALIGLDRIAGYFDAGALELASGGRSLERIPQVSPSDLSDTAPSNATPPAGAAVLDVRTDLEWRCGHLPSALHIPLGYLLDRIAEIPKDIPLVTQCQAGGRSAIAASLLRRAGFHDVSNLVGGFDAWKAAGLPTA